MAGVVAAFQGHGVAKVQAGRTRSQSRISTYGNVRRTLHAPKVSNNGRSTQVGGPNIEAARLQLAL